MSTTWKGPSSQSSARQATPRSAPAREGHASTPDVIEEQFPSIAATRIGRILGTIFESAPQPLGTGTVGSIVFPLLLWPLVLLAYGWSKVAGFKYVVTTAGVHVRRPLSRRDERVVTYRDFASASVDEASRLPCYRTGDVVLWDAGGREVLRLPGVPLPERFVSVIEAAAESREQVERSLAAIEARVPSSEKT